MLQQQEHEHENVHVTEHVDSTQLSEHGQEHEHVNVHVTLRVDFTKSSARGYPTRLAAVLAQRGGLRGFAHAADPIGIIGIIGGLGNIGN